MGLIYLFYISEELNIIRNTLPNTQIHDMGKIHCLTLNLAGNVFTTMVEGIKNAMVTAGFTY